jgi:hypothetical protein
MLDKGDYYAMVGAQSRWLRGESGKGAYECEIQISAGLRRAAMGNDLEIGALHKRAQRIELPVR